MTPGQAMEFCQAVSHLDAIGFWTSDAEGRITHLSGKALDRLPGAVSLVGQPLTDVFRGHEDLGGSGRSLRFMLSRRSRLERMAVHTGEGEDRRWWLLSGEARGVSGDSFGGFAGVISEITDERRIAEENADAAMHDPLTGLLNRRQMSQTIQRTLAAYGPGKRPCATMLIDLDRFKQVNDTLGHSAGDALLKQVAERLQTIIGDTGTLCRLGGDEFQVLLPDMEDRGDLGQLAERVIAMVSQPYSVAGSRCTIGASVGIAVSPFDGADADELARNVDLALYAAKHKGRGSFRFFTGELLTAAEDRRQLEEALHDAVTRGEFELHYQPLVGAQSDTVIGAEALIRWNHPEKGMISPAQFIPIAEESALIRHIGDWVLRTACHEAARWPGNLKVAVNISPTHFCDAAFPATVANALASSGLAPERLELEITESVFLADGSDTASRFRALKTLGVRLALDDFGTGYSSLAYLRTAPFDKIKIDQSFVRGVSDPGSRNGAIIAAIVGLAAALGMDTTAEGIETHDQLELMRAIGVGQIQGYIYSRPMNAAAFLEGAGHSEWGITPEGPARQRNERISMFRWIGAIHEDHYYPVVLRNLSATGALIEGLEDVPAGTRFVLYFGEGQLETATVRRVLHEQLGLEFDRSLVNDGNGGLCTRSRVSTYDLVSAGLPTDIENHKIRTPIGSRDGKLTIPAFTSTIGRKAINGTMASGQAA
ncbi:putative bifunctional diguanylate cyclase/phosphodiesterase [Novosphingobium colocasiae]|nr:EAL domain-containing protein [Novosphingobium colocasiae]